LKTMRNWRSTRVVDAGSAAVLGFEDGDMAE
jgi:hypothetical protein